MVRIMAPAVLLVLSTLAAADTRAPAKYLPTPRFGPEWTFTNPELIAAGSQEYNRVLLAARTRLVEHLKAMCADPKNDCEIKGDPGEKFKVVELKFKDGTSFEIVCDAMVIEVNATPLTVEGWKS